MKLKEVLERINYGQLVWCYDIDESTFVRQKVVVLADNDGGGRISMKPFDSPEETLATFREANWVCITLEAIRQSDFCFANFEQNRTPKSFRALGIYILECMEQDKPFTASRANKIKEAHGEYKGTYGGAPVCSFA
jgi:hypothetical protein